MIYNNKMTTIDSKPEFYNWLLYELEQLYTIPENSPEWLKKTYKQDLMSYSRLHTSILTNVIKIRRYKKTFGTDIVNMICTAFRVDIPSENQYANYCLMYSVPRSKIETKTQKIKKEIGGDVVPIFYIAAPALVSQDGEYRSRVFNHIRFNKIRNANKEIFNTIEDFILEKIKQNNLVLSFEHFHPYKELERYVHGIDEQIISGRFLINCFIHFWLVELYNINVGLQENHINPKYNLIIFKDLATDLKFLKSLYITFGKQRLYAIIADLDVTSTKTSYLKDDQSKNEYKLGHKLIPMNVADVQHPFDINYKSWRELFMTNRASSLVADFICPSFPLIISWFYVKSAKKGLFDNDQQYKKLENSERALVLINKLREAQRLTFNIEHLKFKDVEIPINNALKKIGEDISEPIEDAKSKLLISNVAMGVLFEHVGRTFYDIPILETHSPYWRKTIGTILDNKDMFAKYIMDLCYACVSMNVHAGMVHSDIHLNNCTIFPHKMYGPIETSPKNTFNLWYIGNQWFKIPANGYYSYLIDFSRATIHEDKLTGIDKDQRDKFLDSQKRDIIERLSNDFPSFIRTHMADLKTALDENFDKIYKIYSAIDIYSFSEKMLRHYANTASKDNLHLLTKLKKTSEYYLSTMLSKVIRYPGIEVEWPNIAIIKESFSDYIIDINIPIPEKQILDVWSVDRPHKHDISNYKTWPSYLQTYHTMTKRDDPSTIKIHPDPYDYMYKYLEQTRAGGYKMVDYIAERHIYKYGE